MTVVAYLERHRQRAGKSLAGKREGDEAEEVAREDHDWRGELAKGLE